MNKVGMDEYLERLKERAECQHYAVIRAHEHFKIEAEDNPNSTYTAEEVVRILETLHEIWKEKG